LRLKGVASAAQTARRRTRRMSAEARERISDAKKKWWAKKKRLGL
jgi:hypothetical protein